ncbi:oligosaccharyltransferase complex subunit delta (ribophorin II) [Geosmithia morbida]|uniref:Oligosaccharyltransferase complex subunit delta (Ribophorin II) n=1 Tax=Geosmithia morbida TaxID=1094350 RepID=A0A9P4Z008_9HYPO|nr:oligosaccharyltransferase complex subunit delta (ribophorin II) [Geosmithia morbida]KAF4124914.1 oligosaccharyltransferase complex subunit delta (ribophorin II) [Geosmithia morbida]
MRFPVTSTFTLLAGAAAAAAASSWGFSDASVQAVAKSGVVDSTHTFSDSRPAAEPVVLGHTDKLKVSLTTKSGSSAKKPHQAFLMVREESGLEAPFALTLKGSGKGTVEIKDLPVQLLVSPKPLKASLVLGSFGSDQATISPAFDIVLQLDANANTPVVEPSLRYGKQPNIHHIFRGDPKSPPIIVSIVFSLAVVATVPALFIGWTVIGGNLSHAKEALSNAPIAHVGFLGSIIAMEGVFFLYYSGLKLFSVLPFMGAVGLVAVLSGSKALGEVQSRRLAGER